MIFAVPFRFARRFLGVKVADPEFPPEAFADAATSVMDRLQQECAQLNENLLVRDVLVQPDSADGRTYTMATQTSPVTGLMRAMEVRLEKANGLLLDELPLSMLGDYRSLTYSLLGGEDQRVLQTSEGVPAGKPLFLRYVPAGVAVANDGDTVPAFIPSGYADLVGLLIAEMLWPQGGEQAMPRDQAERMEDRLGQLFERWGKQTPTVARRRMSGDGETPSLF